MSADGTYANFAMSCISGFPTLKAMDSCRCDNRTHLTSGTNGVFEGCIQKGLDVSQA